MRNFKLFATTTAVDPVAEAEAELARLNEVHETARADAQRLGHQWLHAASQSAAEEIDRQRVEAERLVQRAEAQIPEIEQKLVSAKSEKQREGLARHKAAIAGALPKFISAVERAAAEQIAMILMRQAAVAELGEQVVQGRIGAVGYAGLLIPEFVREWKQELLREFNPPPAAQSVPVSRSTATKANGHAKPPATIPAPARPKRAPRADQPAQSDEQATVVFLRGGVELPDGQQAIVGDRITMTTAQAQAYALRGAAEIVP